MISSWDRWSPARRTWTVALAIFVADQISKGVVTATLPYHEERVVVDGFFRFVHWGNTGAAWSVFSQRNGWLAAFSSVAVAALWMLRRQFEYHRPGGQLALGLLFGGIFGNLVDRLRHDHVVDFLRFYWIRRSGEEIGFPAFNVADMAISFAVVLLLFLTWQTSPAPSASDTAAE
jgi:signal peptidase II